MELHSRALSSKRGTSSRSRCSKTEWELGEKLAEKRRLSFAALDVLEQRLTGREYLVADRFTLADIGLYAYTRVTEEGGFSIARYPAIRANPY